jgi:hypothetical protein
VTTANTIIRGALAKLGIVSPGEAVKAADGETCLTALNAILNAWRTERLYAYATQRIAHTAASDAASLTIGPSGADITATPRPDRFENGCFYTLGGVDYLLEPVTEAEFNEQPFKAVTGTDAACFFYNPGLPLGTLRFFPRIPSGAALTLIAQQRISAFADLTTDYGLPAGYERALMFTLAEEVASEYEREIPPTVARNASNARRMIKRANNVVPQLTTERTNVYTYGISPI